jgi:hypothetical protein
MTAIALAAVCAAAASIGGMTAADAQLINLSAPFVRVHNCLAAHAGPPALAYVTRHGWDLNLASGRAIEGLG